MTRVIDGEEGIVQGFLAPLAAGYAGAFGLADDCAAITPTPGHDLVVKTDPVAAGVHFLADDAPEDIAWKALAVNVSDLAAKAALPSVYLMALSFPAAPARDWMARFAAGLAAAQRAFGMHLVGGDTDRRPGPLTVSITVVGEVPAGRMVRRAGARPGDALYVTGTLGDAALGLRIRRDAALAARLGLDDAEARHVVGRYLRPAPRLAMRAALAAHAAAAMDLSDGLAKDLDRMCRASAAAAHAAGADGPGGDPGAGGIGSSSFGADVALGRLPLSQAFAKALAGDPTLIEAAVAGGDDYELLIAVRPAATAAFEAAVAQARGQAGSGPMPAATRIGSVTASGGVRLVGADGRLLTPSSAGWEHFGSG